MYVGGILGGGYIGGLMEWGGEEGAILYVGGIVCSVPLALVTARGGRHLSLHLSLHRKSRFRAGGYSWLKLERGVLCGSEKILR